jgi:hypothetical protein
VVYAKWRDGSGRQVMRRLGPAWLVPEGGSDRKPRGARVGDWVERRGRPVAGALDVRAAHEAMRRVIDEHEAARVEQALRDERIRERGVTFERAALSWLEERRVEREWSHSTASDYADVIRRLCGAIGRDEVAAITEEDLVRLLASLRPRRNGAEVGTPASNRMRKKYRLVLRQVFHYAERRGWAAVNPAERLETPKPPRKSKNHALRRDEYLTPEEVHAVLRAAETLGDGAFFLRWRSPACAWARRRSCAGRTSTSPARRFTSTATG